jgi:acetyl-CoA synthetase
LASAAEIVSYERTHARLFLANGRQEFIRSASRGLNIAYECVGRHAQSSGALISLCAGSAKTGRCAILATATWRLSNRFANVLRDHLGIGKGDRVFALAGRIPELYIAALGALKNGSAFCPLFSAFGPEPIQQRLTIGEGKVLVTTRALYERRKISSLRASLPALKHVVVIGSQDDAPPSGTENTSAAERC